MYSIPDLEAFVTVAHNNSVTAAARQMGISAATASHRLAKLEQVLKVSLFHRNSRNLSLTDEGQIFLERVEGILEELRQAEFDVGGGKAPLRGHLRATMSPWILSRFIMPHLCDFKRQHPDLTLEFLAVDRFVPLVEEAQDCAIRIGNLSDSSLIAQKLCDNERIICASPSFLENYGEPKTLQDLQDACWICLPWQTSFEVKTREGKKQQIKALHNIAVSSSDMLTDGAIQGLGLAMKSRMAVQQELESGKLVEVMTDTLMPYEAPVWFVFAPRARVSRKTKEFLKLARQAFQEY